MTRFAGQALDITQFMPKDGPQYDKISDQVLASNSLRRTADLNAKTLVNASGVNALATAQIGNQKGQMMISQGKMNAAKIIGQAKSGGAATSAQGDVNQFSGMMNGLTGLAKGGFNAADELGMFDKNLANDYSPTGAPGFGAENVDWMKMPGYFGNPP